MNDYSQTGAPQTSPRRAIILFAALIFPFFVNDFMFIALAGSQSIYVADYLWRICVLIAAILFAREISFAPGRPKSGIAFACVGAVTAIIAGLALGHFVEVPLVNWLGRFDLFSFPVIETMALYWFDLTLGLFLVALSEELVFRRVAFRALTSAGVGSFGVVAISSIAFGLMHWGKGPGNVVSTILTGVIMMLLYRFTGRLWPCVLAHWAINFIIFL